MSDTFYCYPPDYKILRNRFDIRDTNDLDSVEAEFVSQRMRQLLPVGDFDLKHLKSIHHHLFPDVYDWAGELRTVEISKGGNQFMFRQYISQGMADVHRRIINNNYLEDLAPGEFSRLAGPIMGDINYIYPFREGNGRSQMMFLKQLSQRAGHQIDLTRIDKKAWMNASQDAHQTRYDAMSECIAGAIVV